MGARSTTEGTKGIKMSAPNEYSVCDLGAVAYLCKGFRHTALKPTGKNAQLAFVFADQTARDEVNNYFSGAMVPARAFADCLRAAKSLIYDLKPVYRKDHADFLATGGAR